MLAAFLGCDKFFNLVREKDSAYLVVILNSRERYGCCYFGYHVALLHSFGSEVTACRHVDKQHHGKFPLFFVYLYIGMVLARRHIPVNVANIVTVLVGTNFREHHAATFECRMVLAGKNVLRKSACLYFYLANLFYKFI